MGPLVRLQAGTSTLSKAKERTEASTRAIGEHRRSCECDKDFIVFFATCRVNARVQLSVCRCTKHPRAQMFAEELVRDLVDLSQIGSKTVRWDWIWLSLEFFFQFLIAAAKKKQKRES